MEKKHRISYDSSEGSAFIVHNDKGEIRFEKTPENLFVYKPTYHLNTTGMSLLETVQSSGKLPQENG